MKVSRENLAFSLREGPPSGELEGRAAHGQAEANSQGPRLLGQCRESKEHSLMCPLLHSLLLPFRKLVEEI